MKMNIYRFLKLHFLLPAILLIAINHVHAQIPSHDPTQIVKDGGRYWTFTTGNDVWHMSAADAEFDDWRQEGGVFPEDDWPDWINDRVPGFDGHFWAPGIIYMDGEWHLYYSCSTFGSQTSAIGLVTTPSIADSAWTDQGMAVFSNNNRESELGYNVNAIDADLMRDKDDRVWLLYGSYWDGIVMTELDTTTGKPIDETDLHLVANNGPEAGYVMWHGDYYYLFFNRGSCCSDVNSTYRMLMGRSTSPTGPFYDKDSVMTHEGGGSLFLHTDGRFIGPGHFGYGHDKLTYHYYDGMNNGWSFMGIGSIEWGDDGWPVAQYDRAGAIANGTYVITNSNSDKVLDLANGDTINGTNVVQNTVALDSSKYWDFTHVGQGYYKISPALAPGKALEIADGSTNGGANAQIGNYDSLKHQLWYAGRMTDDGIYRIAASHSYQMLEIANANTNDGANAIQWSFNEHATQQWTVTHPDDVVIPEPVANNRVKKDHLSLYPNPSNGDFTVQYMSNEVHEKVRMEIYRMDGRMVYSSTYKNTDRIDFTGELNQGMYQVKLIVGNAVMTQKLMVQDK